MARLVAFLGGVNVGGHRVTMDRLRDEFSALGFSDVETFIASGNVIFSATGSLSGLETRIEQHLGERLGWPAPTYLRKAGDVRAVVDFVATKPFGSLGDGHTHMVALTKSEIGASQQRTIEGSSTARDRFFVHGREVHWLIDGKLTDSAITLPNLVKLIGRNTTRNITSMTRLADRL